MKSIKIYMLLILVFSACKKDDQELPQESMVKEFQAKVNSDNHFCTNYIPTFCENNSNDPMLRVLKGDGVNIKVGDNYYELLPLELFEGTKGIAIKVGSEIYIMHNSQDEYLTSKNTDIELPLDVGILLNIEFEETDSRNVILSKIMDHTGRQLQTHGEEFYIDLSDMESIIGFSSIRECDYRLVTSVDLFVDEFLYGGDVDADNVPDLIEEAFEACPYPFEVNMPNRCNYCKDPRCLIDYLLNLETELSDYQKQILTINYLRATLNLSDEEFTWFKTGEDNRVFAIDIYNLVSTTYNCNNIEVVNWVFNSENCDLENLAYEEYTNCILDELVSAFSEENGFVIVENENDEVTNVTVSILPYSCRSFYLDEVGLNTYLTTISNLLLSFNHVERIFPPRYNAYNFNISLDIEVVVLPGAEKCEIKNTLASVLNEAVQDVVQIFGMGRVYLLPNAQNTIETDLEIALETLLLPHYPLGRMATVPAENFLGGNQPIPIIPGQEDNCCD